MTRVSLYEFAGGDQAWLAFKTAFHELCMADPEPNHPFSHSGPPHIEHLASYWGGGLPDDPGFRATNQSYIEWAVKEVDTYRAPGSIAPAGRPMPHWSWNGLET